jgi:glycerophosphoryl diester phosphodiesterase
MPGRPLRLAHRGDHRRALENTIPALRAALAVPGCDGLEFDVRSAADGVPVLLHDETLERVQGRPERVSDLSAERLATLGIPSLAATLRAVGPTPFLDVELKEGVDLAALVQVLEDGRGRGLDRTVVSAFEPETLEAVGRLRPGWPRWLNAEDAEPATLRRAVDLGCRGVSIDWRAIDERAADRVGDAGLELAGWTVRRRQTWDRLARLGVVALCVEGAALDG